MRTDTTQHLRPEPSPKKWLICFSHLRWNFVYQRPQHLLTRAARSYRVTYIEEPVFEAVAVAAFRVERNPSGVEMLTPVLPHGLSGEDVRESLQGLLDDLVDAQPIAIAWYYTPMALEFSHHLEPELIVYDCMDELSAFRGAPPTLIENERRLLERADVVFTGGQSLYEAKRDLHPSVYAFPSSVDVSHFARARQGAEADRNEQPATPRVGFFGVIDERMDLGLVEALAKLRPDIDFEIVGPVVKIDPGSLPQQSNIHWLGPIDYARLPECIGGWDAAFMPFALNESTRFISPTKTPEFLAAGRPVVSTAVADVVSPYGEKGLVEIASDAAQMSEAIDRCLAMPRGPWLRRVDKFLSGTSWDKTWGEMAAVLGDGRPAGTGTSVRSSESVVGEFV